MIGSALLLGAALSLTAAAPAGAAFPGANGKIAFTRTDDGGRSNIWTVDPATGQQQQLTSDNVSSNPAWSPDGSRIAFVGNTADGPEIVVINADGTNRQQVTTEVRSADDPAWAPNGLKIAYAAKDTSFQVSPYLEVATINVDGTDRTVRTWGGGWHPAWRPDGSLIAFSTTRDTSFWPGGAQVWLVSSTATVQESTDPRSGEVVRQGPEYPFSAMAYEPNWSPDGTKLVFTMGGDLYVINADGTERSLLAASAGTSVDEHPAWSPDATRIVFRRNDGSERIWTMAANGSDARAVTTPGLGSKDTQPDWEPAQRDTDADRDGVSDGTDNCATVFNPDQRDSDGDRVGDECDVDRDGDAVDNAQDNCPDNTNAAQTNTDGDGVGDACDPDDDGDGVADASDNCALTANSGQGDTDMDGRGDACDTDDDADGIADASDNCSLTPNPSQNDTDGDGQGDVCDPLTYQFGGFFSPVDNMPTVNSVKAGASIPVKFSLTGDRGLAVIASTYPLSQEVSCSSTAPVDGIEETAAPGAATLSYDAVTDRYTYVWKTSKPWAGRCRQFVLKTADGAIHRAAFKFT